MACAMTVAITLFQSYTHTKVPAHYMISKITLNPIFWSTALVAACWLLFGNEENNNTDK